MSDELKPCPFCNARQLTDDEAGETLPYQGEYRACDGCGCVSKDWNTRPIEDELRAEIEKLKHALSQQTARADLEMANALGAQAEIERLNNALDVLGNELNYVSTEIFGHGPGNHCLPWDFARAAREGGER